MPGITLTAQPRRTVVRPMTGAEVFVKRRWTDRWTWISFVVPTNIHENVAPSMSTATLKYRFGKIKWAEFASFGIWNFYTIGGAYVRIDAVDPFGRTTLFVGEIDVETVAAHGTTGFPSGRQTWECFGLEHVMDRNKMHGSITEDGWIDRPITFNRTKRRGFEVSGNRSGDVFGPAGTKWSNKDIVEYILKHYVNVLDGPTYALSGTAVDMLDQIFEEHDFDGMTPWQALNQLIDRRRALGWYLDFNADADGTIFLHVFSSLSVPISVNDTLMAANDNQRTLTFAGFRDVRPEFVFNLLSTYSSILVRGGPIYSCLTIAYADGTLQKGWTDEQETELIAGSTVEGADATAHDIARKQAKFRNVYQRHELKDGWDGYSGNGLGGYGDMVEKGAGPDTFGAERVVTPRNGMINAMPGVNLFGEFNDALNANYWVEGMTFERTLPIEVEGSDENEPEYRKMFVVVNVPDDEEPPNDRWIMVNALDTVEIQKAGLQIATSGLAFYVEPLINHVLGLNHFDTAEPEAADTNTDAAIDYTTMIATVNLKTDWRLFVRWGLPGNQYSETPRELLILVPGTELWRIAEGTVLDVQDDEGDGVLLKRQGAGGETVRDDTSQLIRIAQIAAAFHGQPRSVLTYETSRITRVASLGMLVRGVVGPEGFTDVGTVVTSIVHTFSGDATSTRVATNYEELDAKVA